MTGDNLGPAYNPGGTEGALPPVRELTVLYDSGCRLCRTARRWLSHHEQLVPLRFVPAGSPEARQRFPSLDHAATRRDITVVSDAGQVWMGDGAWLTCLWALTAFRGLAHRLSSPQLRPLAERVVSTAARIRARQYGDVDDPACVDQCRH